MSKIEKPLARLALKDRQRIETAVELILSREWSGLDVKKLSGLNIWRVRSSNFRIKFAINKNKITILAIERRSNHTY